MASKEELMEQRKSIVVNDISKREDKLCQRVVLDVIDRLKQEFGVEIIWEKKILLTDIIAYLRKNFPSVTFCDPENENSFMTPDGGITFMLDHEKKRYPIMIGEVKNQGTNDRREKEGKKKQPQGNAIERLGKNVIGFRTLFLTENIFPFVCFGDGCDFEEGSSILDRVLTIAMFGEINKDNTANVGPNGVFNRGSFFFREEFWTYEEMFDVFYGIGKKSIYYYFSKYGDEKFR